MKNDSKKADGKSLVPFSMKMREEEKDLFQRFAKLNNLSIAELLKTGAKELMVSRGCQGESQILGILERGLPYHIVRVPDADSDAFYSLTAYLKERGYVMWGEPFMDKEGFKLQFMVLKQPDKKIKK